MWAILSPATVRPVIVWAEAGAESVVGAVGIGCKMIAFPLLQQIFNCSWWVIKLLLQSHTTFRV